MEHIFVKYQKILAVIAGLAIFITGGLYGPVLYRMFNNSFSRTTFTDSYQLPIREISSQFQFTSHLLLLGDLPELRGSYSSLEKQINHLIQSAQTDSKLTDASVYFRDLTSAKWFGVNEKAHYFPASIFKVALMISVLKIAESDITFLSKRVIFNVKPENRTAPAELTAPALEYGKTYTIKDLISQMIIYSDNDAYSILRKIIGESNRDRVFVELRLPVPTNETSSMSPEEISRFFRVIYNSTYLPKELSEFALEVLSHSDFTAGLKAGVPNDVVVSDKYGYRAGNQTSNQELHDCGIIYYPANPFFLCVMTRGKDLSDLEDFIQTITQTIYSYVDQQSH